MMSSILEPQARPSSPSTCGQPSQTDPTFRNYTPAAASAYLAGRARDDAVSYAKPLYNEILSYHFSASPSGHNPGGLTTLLDVGCGPGNSTRGLALLFDHAIGADPGEAMIETAKKKSGRTGGGRDVRWIVCEAEECGKLDVGGVLGVEGSKGEGKMKVDMITAGMAAHWFHMPTFWIQAGKILKQHGTVALWTHSSLYCHPNTPNAPLIQSILYDLELLTLAPYSLPQNDLSRLFYDALPLPWTCTPPILSFPQSLYKRITWDRDGILSDGKDFFGGGDDESLDHLERSLGTASMVSRWRDAHPELAGTEEDCVRVAVRRIEEALGGVKRIKLGSGTTLLLFRKQSR